MDTLERNGVELPYEVRGSGDSVVLLHGGGCQLEDWEPVVSRLAETHRTIAYDRRGNGRSRSPQSPDLRIHAEDAAMLIEELVGGAAIVVGWSRGASVALLLAVSRPELVRSLVLIEAPYHFGTDPSVVPFILHHMVLSRLLRKTARDRHEYASRWVMRSHHGREVWDDLDEGFRESHLRNLIRLDQAEHRHTRYSDDLTGLRSTEVARCPVPVTCLRGEESIRPFALASRRLAKALPEMRTIVVPGTTHALPLQDPDAVVAAVLEADSRSKKPTT